MKAVLTLFFILTGIMLNAQQILKMEGKTYTNSESTWVGVNILRSSPTSLTFRNNTITSVNTVGYMLQAGDERAASTNNNLDNALITGNKFIWKGTDMTCITHGLFTGHNSNVTAKYNYLNEVPMGIIRKSTTNMSNTGGAVAYNIVKGGAVAVVVKGMSNVNIYNNTLYSNRTTSQTWRPLINVYTNNDSDPHSVSHGTKIFNNIFYTKYQTFAISIDDNESLTGLKCDYNIYWCESGSPRFSVAGSTKTFAQWQAMGYDLHSVVMNPKFKDFESFIPQVRLNFGTDLGEEWKSGLSVNAKWGNTDPETADQNGVWQVGAVIYGAPVVEKVAPAYTGSSIKNAAPTVLEINFDTTMADIIPALSAFSVKVNSVSDTITSIVVEGSIIKLTLLKPVLYGDVVTFSYIKPDTNALASAGGALAAALTDKPVINSVIENINPPVVVVVPPVVAVDSPVVVIDPPVYVGAVVGNTSSSRLEITYNMTLANVVPPRTAFTAMVNGKIRAVNSVSISGNTVIVSLTGTITSADKVKFSYSKPSGNPLQASNGAAAESLNGVSVVNKIPESLTDGQDISIFPNPAGEYITIANLKPTIHQRIMRIFNYSGRLFMEMRLDAESIKRIPLNLKSGMYLVQILAGPVVEFAHTLIVVE